MNELDKDIYVDLLEQLKANGPGSVSTNKETDVIEQTIYFSVEENDKVESYILYLTFPIPTFIRCVRNSDGKNIPLEK